jgi:hypothetical protein
VQDDPKSDIDEAAEFFRRGDDGDYIEAESLPAGSTAFANSDEQPALIDPKLLERQLERRARYTRWVMLGMGALSLVTGLGLFTHVLNPRGDFPEPDGRHLNISGASPGHASERPTKGPVTPPSLEPSPVTPVATDLPAQVPSSSAPIPEAAIVEHERDRKDSSSAVVLPPTPPAARSIAQSQRSTGSVATAPAIATAPRSSKAALAGARGVRRQALASSTVAKSISRSGLPASAVSKVVVQSPPSQGASHPPTARFAD